MSRRNTTRREDALDSPTTLAVRVRQLRFAKGWGPDELAARANISRTALYQIESGKTSVPRAGTMRSLARALGVDAQSLADESAALVVVPADRLAGVGGEAEPVVPVARPVDRPTAEAVESNGSAAKPRWLRDLELESKFRRLLASPYREGLARIVEQTYLLIPPELWESSN